MRLPEYSSASHSRPGLPGTIVILCCLWAVGAGHLRGADAPPDPGLEIVGHRGCAGLMPENTMGAFEHAIDLGVDSIELDLRLTRDAVLVVLHDPRLDPSRCVDERSGKPVNRLAVQEQVWEDLAQVQCSMKSDPGRRSRVPRLEEVLELARGAPYPLRLNLEIKERTGAPDAVYEEIAGILVEAVREYDLGRRVVVQSFGAAPLRAVAERAPELELGVIVRKPKRYASMLEQSGATILLPRHDRLRESDVRRFEEQGIRVVPWTVDDPETMRRLIGWGVDGLITDYPDRAIGVIKEEGRTDWR